MNKRDLTTLKEKTLVSSIDMNQRDLKTLKEKTLVSGIDMNKRDLKKLTKAQLIRLLLKQQAQKPIPPPRTGKWENVKPKPLPRKSVKQMVNEYEDIIQPPDGYKPIPKPSTDRQNARRPPKPQRSPPPPPSPQKRAII